MNQRAIRVIGLRRTGNHAIMHWLEKQHTGDVFHLNNVKAGDNPYRYKSENLAKHHPEHQHMSAVYRRQSRGEYIQRDCLLYSYEDWGLEKITHSRFERHHDLYLGRSQKRYDVLILRDPFNLMASRLKNNYMPVKSKRRTAMELWLQYAKEFVGETQYLRHNRICINYNRWFEDEAYRQQLADTFEISFSDAGLTRVRTMGGGSSFDGRTLNGQARQMKVNHRWQHFVDNPTYRELFEDPQVWQYSQKIFGDIEGTEQLRSQTHTTISMASN